MNGWEIFQIWVIAFFTLSLFSFMYKDNPFYKVAEHIFAGLSAGYYVGLIWDAGIITQAVYDEGIKRLDGMLNKTGELSEFWKSAFGKWPYCFFM